MKIQVETISPVEKKVVVEVDASRVGRELDKAYADLGRRVKLKGFRPGKAPRQVLEKNFRDDVERDVARRLIDLAFGEAVSGHGVEAVAAPRADITEPGLQAEQPFRFTVRVEVKPQLTPKDYKGLEITRRKAVVTDAMVDKELEALRDSLAKLVPVEGREVAAEGDYALIDHEGTVDGQPFEGGKAEGVTVRVADGDFFAGFFPQLGGLRVGERRDVEQGFPADFRVEALRGKTARFGIVLRGLQTRQVAALDDAFAKGLGAPGVENLEQLRADLRRRIEVRERQRERAEVNDAVIKAALAKNDFEVPPALVERAIDSMLEGAAQRFARQGMDIREMELDVARLRADLREQALLQVRGALLLEAVAEAEKIEPGDAELEAEVGRLAEEAGIPAEKLRPQLRSAEARSTLRNRVREDQVLAFLATHAKITDAAPEA
jgi:trigger factor